MKVAYRAYERSGREVTDVIDATSIDDAAERLRQQDLFVADLSPEGTVAAPKAPAARGPRVRGGKLKNLLMFTRQLGVLLRAGTPLAEGLSALERQSKDASWRQAVATVRVNLEQGIALSKAMEARDDCFDTVYRNMIAAGEKSGKLTEVLERLAVLIRKRVHVRRTLLAAMIYPTLLVVVSLAVFAVMLTVVVPRFAQLFEALDVDLPPTTAGLVAVSDWMRSYWPMLLGGLALGALGLRQAFKTRAGRRARDTVLLRLPCAGNLVRSFATAKIARLLGVLLNSHLPILDALHLTRDAVANHHYIRLLDDAAEAVKSGRAISSTFKGSDLISPSVYEAMHSGEQSGQVSPLLLDLADFMDEENETALKGLISILEPAILVLMGVVVGFVALSIFTPLFDVTGMTQGGR